VKRKIEREIVFELCNVGWAQTLSHCCPNV